MNINAFFRTSSCLGRYNLSLLRGSKRTTGTLATHLSKKSLSNSYSKGRVFRRYYSSFNPVPQVPYGFRELGIRDGIANAIEKSFPNVQRPTIAQADYIPAILNGKDVILYDQTGTGKSFGSIVALLNKPRPSPSHERRGEGRCITSLVIVPHRDLGYQMLHWIETIVERSKSKPPLDSIAQLVVRGELSVEEMIKKLNAAPPHILIGTPQALHEIYSSEEGRAALKLDSISTLVVDEVDYLLDIPPPYVRKLKERSAWVNFRKHPSLTRQLLEGLLPTRKPGALPLEQVDIDDGEGKKKHASMRPRFERSARPLQIVMSSASVHSNVVKYLRDARWVDDDCLILSGKKLLKDNAHMLLNQKMEEPKIVHHAFVVSSTDGRLSNAQISSRLDTEDETKGSTEHPSDPREKLQNSKPIPPQSPTSSHVMEAVATLFAYDVPQLGLLVVPPQSSVQRVLMELKELGVDARTLDMRSKELVLMGQSPDGYSSEPVLLVATPATIRGVDLPQLTHVFCVGAPDTGSVDAFKHIAGRVGRFGRGGKVISIVTERETEVAKGGIVRTTKNPEGLLKVFYRSLGITPEPFDLDALELTAGAGNE